MKIFSLLETQYHDLTRAVKDYLSRTLGSFGESYGNGTVFGQLINVLTDVVQNIMLYIEDALTEQNKYTAQRKKSVWGLAALSGYIPSTGRAASAQITISYIPTNENNLDIIIHNHERLTCTQNGLSYNIILPQDAVVMSIEKDNTSKTVGIVEGRFESQSFTSRGGLLYSIPFAFQGNIDTDYMRVRVRGEEWKREASLYDMDPDGKQYTFKPGLDGKINLLFGNGTHGRPLEDGDDVTVEYLIHNGEYGNIDLNSQCDFSFSDPLTTIDGDEVTGDTVFSLSIDKSDKIASGSNSETADDIRPMIGLNSRALVLADANAYKNFINKFSFCGYNRTWSEKGSLTVNSLIIKNYKSQLQDGKDYFSLTDDDFILSPTQKSSLLGCIENSGQMLAGVSYNIFDPELCKYAATIYVTLKSTKYDNIYISNQIRNLVGEFFSNVDNDMFIPKSDLVNLIKSNIESIDSVDVYFISERNETAIIRGQYTDTTYKYNPASGTYDKESRTVVLYDGENPNLGFDDHGNILIQSDEQFPVLMGGWRYKIDNNPMTDSDDQLVDVVDPLTIVFE